jgi:hypothetical protein
MFSLMLDGEGRRKREGGKVARAKRMGRSKRGVEECARGVVKWFDEG